ncbi:MAG: alpha/beta fold hydrolase [Pseudomonadota bacterium]
MQLFRLRFVIALIALAVALASLFRLEQLRADLDIQNLKFGDTPVSLYRGSAETDLLVLVTHGFAGSRQMMEAISLTLARAGHTVVAFDFAGHGRHPGMLSRDVTRITGTTEDLVQQTLDVAAQTRARTGLKRVAFVGHSMATDVVIRAADRLDSVAGVVAISMYSEAVQPQHPEKLLILSGAQEERLRAVALEAVGQLGEAAEGVTLERDGISRRAAVAPWVGHVGVLWSSTTLSETTDWFGRPASPVKSGGWIAALLAALIVFFWPVSHLLPRGEKQAALPLKRALIAVLAASGSAAAATPLAGSALGVSGFGALALLLITWGAVTLAVLRPPVSFRTTDALSAIVLLFWGIAVFAFALDRYGAAFVPTGPRLGLMLFLLPATVIFGLADRMLIAGRGIIGRALFRLPILATVIALMFVQPQNMGMVFTVLPVLVLFFLVYGTMAHWAEARSGPQGPALATGVILAWALAASTPLFMAS